MYWFPSAKLKGQYGAYVFVQGDFKSCAGNEIQRCLFWCKKIEVYAHETSSKSSQEVKIMKKETVWTSKFSPNKFHFLDDATSCWLCVKDCKYLITKCLSFTQGNSSASLSNCKNHYFITTQLILPILSLSRNAHLQSLSFPQHRRSVQLHLFLGWLISDATISI